MSVSKAEGYADIPALQQTSAAILGKSSHDELSALSETLGELLRPFAAVESTNERWRDEVLAIAAEIHEAMHAVGIDNPPLGVLKAGMDALKNYNKRIDSLQECNHENTVCYMSANRLMDATEKAVEAFAASATMQPLDEWQLRKDAVFVVQISRELIFVVSRNNYAEAECQRASLLLNRIAELADTAQLREGVSASLKEKLGDYADFARLQEQGIIKSKQATRTAELQQEQQMTEFRMKLRRKGRQDKP